MTAARQNARSSRRSAGVGEDHRQGHLAVAEIVADALAHSRRVGRIIDDVVDQLEGDAEVAAVALERDLRFLAGFGDDRRDAAGGGEQRGGLGADDLEILLLAGIDPPLRGQLLDLAFGDHRRRVTEDLEDLQAAVLDHQLERAAEQEIADQDAGRIAPDEVGGALAAAGAGAVDDVVVEQGRGVDELDRGGELVVAACRNSRAGCAQARVSIGRMRLPPPAIRWPASSGIRRDLALHALENDGIDAVHVGRDQGHHRIERRLA